MDYSVPASQEFNMNYYNMTKIWLKRVVDHAPECRVELLYVNEEFGNENINSLFRQDYKNFLNNFNNVYLKKIKPLGYSYNHRNVNHKATYDYKHAVWHEEAPYIFLDTDLFIFSDIKNFYSQVGDAPFVATGHGSYHRKQERALNGGFYYMGKTGYVDAFKAMEVFEKEFPDNPTLDQNVLFAYVKSLGHDPFVVPEAERWNWYGKESKIEKVNGEYKAFDERGEAIFGAHFFGSYRPWRCNHLFRFWEDSVREVEKMSV
jgi:hypothetical protein